jgi:hypothetical protein
VCKLHQCGCEVQGYGPGGANDGVGAGGVLVVEVAPGVSVGECLRT